METAGNERVLDAISQVNGLSQVSSKKIWIARPAPHNFGCQQILPIEWDAITQGAQTATNYQLMPGDRLFVAEDEMITFSNIVAKVTAPIERIAGIMSLGSSTIRGFETMGRNYNRSRNGIAKRCVAVMHEVLPRGRPEQTQDPTNYLVTRFPADPPYAWMLLPTCASYIQRLSETTSINLTEDTHACSCACSRWSHRTCLPHRSCRPDRELSRPRQDPDPSAGFRRRSFDRLSPGRRRFEPA